MTSSSGALDQYAGYLLRRGYVRAMACARASIPEPYHVREVLILTELRARGPLSQHRLADLLDVNPTTMVKLIDRAESEGLITRARDPGDRRANALAPTAKGLTMLRRLEPTLAKAEAMLTANLTAAEHRRLNALLLRMVAEAPDIAGDPLTSYTGYLLKRAHHAVRTHAERALGPLSIEPRHFGVLATLKALTPCSQQRLAAALGVTPPVVLQHVDGLEEHGLVVRTRNRADRRAYDLTLTAEGERRLDAAEKVAGDLQRELAERLGERNERALRRLLGKLLAGEL